MNGYASEQFRGTVRDCVGCALRARCLRTPATTRVRNVACIRERVVPVFANLRHNKRLTRFTMRGRAKVDAQWQLYCLVHNIEKLAHHGYAA